MQSLSEAVGEVAAEGSAGAELPAWLWLGLPPIGVVAMVATALVDPGLHHAWFKAKEGPVEWATVAVLVLAMAAAVGIWRRRALLPARWLGWWMALVGLGSFYYAGEEISWGQHVFGWETPELLAEIRREEELAPIDPVRGPLRLRERFGEAHLEPGAVHCQLAEQPLHGPRELARARAASIAQLCRDREIREGRFLFHRFERNETVGTRLEIAHFIAKSFASGDHVGK